MDSPTLPILLGVFICILGGVNMTGNISSIHWYHRRRVAEENRRAFGKLVGLGTLLIGAGIILFGVLSILAEQSGQEGFRLAGTIHLLAEIVVGLGLSFYAMIKYNKGIF